MKRLTSPFLWVALLAFGLATMALAPSPSGHSRPADGSTLSDASRPSDDVGERTARTDLPAAAPRLEIVGTVPATAAHDACIGATWPNLPAGCGGGDAPVRAVRIVR